MPDTYAAQRLREDIYNLRLGCVLDVLKIFVACILGILCPAHPPRRDSAFCCHARVATYGDAVAVARPRQTALPASMARHGKLLHDYL
eukprot:6171999-Pyramimonas_sp.AAC.1